MNVRVFMLLGVMLAGMSNSCHASSGSATHSPYEAIPKDPKVLRGPPELFQEGFIHHSGSYLTLPWKKGFTLHLAFADSSRKEEADKWLYRWKELSLSYQLADETDLPYFARAAELCFWKWDLALGLSDGRLPVSLSAEEARDIQDIETALSKVEGKKETEHELSPHH